MKSFLNKAVKWAVSLLMVVVMCPTMISSVFADNGVSAVLNDFTTGLSITGVTKNSDDSYSVQGDTEYEIQLSFAEAADGKQFSNDTLKYTFPTGFNVADGISGTLDITVSDSTGTYVVEGNTYTVKDNVLTFKFNSKSVNFSKLTAAANTEFSLKIKGSFSGASRIISWGGKVSCQTYIDYSHNVTITKDGWFDYSDHKAHYKLTVISQGTNTNVVVTDTISGTALQYDGNATASTGSAQSNGNGFIYTIPSMTNGQKVEITYTASVDFVDTTGYMTANQTMNTANVVSKEDTTPDEKTKDFNNQISYYGISKDGAVAGNSTAAGHKLVSWKVTYNNEKIGSVAGRTITDTIDANSASIMKYYGNATVTVKDTSGNVVRSDTVVLDAGSTSFTYKIPTSDTAVYVYEITYQTDVNMSGRTTGISVKNNAGDDNGRSTSKDVWVGPNEDSKIDASKTATAVTKDKVTWTIQLDVPTSGLTSADLYDYLPSTWLSDANKTVWDELDGSVNDIKVTGLNDTESYTASLEDNGHTVHFIFYKDSSKKTSGLNGGTSARTVTITITTKNNSEWLDAAKTNDSYSKHENKIKYVGNGAEVWRTADAVPPVPYILKKSVDSEKQSGTIDGLPYFSFKLKVRGFDSSSATVSDTFEMSLYQIRDDTLSVKFLDMDKKNLGTGSITAQTTDTGVQFSLTNIPANAVYAVITYDLQVKDADALTALKKAAAADTDSSSAVVNNNAEYKDASSEASSKYTYEGVTKKLVNEKSNLYPSDGSKATAHYQIVVNKDAVDMLSGSDMITVTDTFSDTLSIDYDSIKVSPNTNVTYDVKGDTATFYVPDDTEITIEYDAKVIGQGNSVEIKNEVSLNGYKTNTDTWAKGTTVGQGTASIYSINLMKYETGNMEKRLSGVTFALYKQNGTAVTDKQGSAVTFTTGNDGKALVSGDMDKDGWTLVKGEQYYLVETNTPAGYKEDVTHYTFSVGDSANYSSYTYYNGDTLKIGNVALISSTVKKVWADSNDQDGIRPDSLKVTLTGTKTVSGVTSTVYTKNETLSDQNSWKATEDSLPSYDSDGSKITYTWSEEAVEGYTLTSAVNNNVTTLTNTHAAETTEATVTKVWKDADDQDGNRPENLTVNLSNGSETVGTVVLNQENSWTASITGLPKNSAGKAIQYKWEEASLPEGYTLTNTFVNGTVTTLTNSYSPATTSAKIVKIWKDAENQDGKRPASLNVSLMNGTAVVKTVTLKAENSWTATVTDLPVYANGSKINYTWAEPEVADYTLTNTSVSADSLTTTLTNTHIPASTSLTVAKSWNDADNQDGKRPASLDVNLMNGTAVVKTVTLKAENSWTATVTDLPVYANGSKINYTWAEAEVADYTLSKTEVSTDKLTTTLTNTHTPASTSLTVAKSWNDADNQDGKRPASLDVNLMNGTAVVKTVTLKAENRWTATVTDLPVYANGAKINYTWAEPEVADYTLTNTAVSADSLTTTFTNTHTAESTNITVNKVWADDNNTEGFRPDSVVFYLQKTVNGKTSDVEGRTYTLTKTDAAADDTNKWSYTFNNLPVYESGQKIAYSVRESNVDDHYTASTDATGLTITNTRTVEKTNASGTKTWSDAGNEGARPAFITVYLYASNADGAVASKKVTAADDWTYQFTDLQKYSGGQEIKYTVGEDKVENYTSQASGMNLKNTYNPGKTSVTATKKWVDLENANGTRPASIQVQLYRQYSADDEAVAVGSPVTLKNDTWTYTWNDLDQKHNGTDIIYTVRETEVPAGYVNTVAEGNAANNYTIENTCSVGNLVIKKTFDGDNITEEDKDQLVFEVKGPNGYDKKFKYGEDFAEDGTLTLKNLEAGDYTVNETNPKISGYDVTVAYTVGKQVSDTNKVSANQVSEIDIKDNYEELGRLVIKKTFDGDNITEEDKANLKFEITAPDGTKTSISLSQFTKNDDGSYTYTVEKAADGEYTVKETNAEIEGYDVTVTESVNGQDTDKAAAAPHQTAEVDIKNSYTQKIADLVIVKSFDGDNITDKDKANLKFEITKPDGTKQTVSYAEFTDGKYTMKNVPTGNYSVREVNPEIEGYDVTVAVTVDGKSGSEASLVPHAVSTIVIKDSYSARPVTPATPERPTTPVTPERPASPSTPNTSDGTNAPLAAGMMGFSLLAAGFVLFFKKKYSA